MSDIKNIGEQTDLFKLFVGQIPKEMDEMTLRQYFEEFGPIVEISIIRDNVTMMSKGCAFVTYSYEHSAQMAVDKLHDKVQLPNSLNPLQVRYAETQVDRENKLFIGMLPKTMGEQDLHDMFSMYGELREVHVIRGPEGGAKGCAFVKFMERDAAIAAIDNLNDTTPAGGTRPLVVKFADGKKSASKEDPWQQSMYRGMGGPVPGMHMGGQQRMMYPYAGMGQAPLGMAPGQSTYSNQQGGMGQPRYGYPPQGAAYGAQQESGGSSVASKPPGGPPGGAAGADAEFAVARGDSFEAGLEVLPPAAGSTGASIPPAAPMHAQQYSMESESSHVRPPEGPSGANLFIYHLPRDLTDADLATLFAPFGNVISAKVFVDKKTSDSKGFGFVSYDTLENANSAIESMNGFQIGSKRLKVQHKRVLGGGGGHTPGIPQHNHYDGGMMHHQPMHLAGPGSSPYGQMQQPSAYYRTSPLPVTSTQGMMMSTSPIMQAQQQYGGVQGMGGMGMMQGGMGAGGYPQQMQMRGNGAPGMGVPGHNRMQPTTAAPSTRSGGGGGGYSYPSYPSTVPAYGGQQQQQQLAQQRSGVMMTPARGPGDMSYGGIQSSAYPTDGQQQQHAGGQSPLGGPISYVDGSKSAQQQPVSGTAAGYYGQY
eukprot:CAMPEP_0170425196 /NCGR_PEP_ID=MMETSP0117_2-20130122/37978_1 /TAXON_ID=400756 /ORGANISM="Durinskia baltica, Strain CSIRO CS-38" /LENGTH=647 /DNA_ID=CAMNT_0010684147 /DNA_START=147 /DNA_END=2090 /DNA_ORIENTATION=+